MELAIEAKKERFKELDALRGLAALIVVFYHAVLMAADLLPPPYLQILTVVRPFWAGQSAVTLFFTLSGFVLFLPYLHGRSAPYGLYLLRRICRIYLPYLAALGIAVLGAYFFHNQLNSFSTWSHMTWNRPVDARLVVQHILFIVEGYDLAQYNNAFWSLVVEMRLSIIFPLFALLALRVRWPWLAALAVGLALVGPMIHRPAVEFASLFLLGIVVAANHEAIARIVKSLKISWILLVVLALVIFGSPPATKLVGLYALLAQGGCSALFIVASLHFEPMQKFLSHPFCQWLGRISYSMYLVHIPILYASTTLLQYVLPYGVIVPIYVVAVGLASEVFNRFVEQPAQRLGKVLTQKSAG